jgi:predicted Zn-dependent protease
VTALNGELIALYGTANWMARWLARNGTKPVRVDLRRDGVHQTVIVTPVMGCSIPIRLVTKEEINAHTDGETVTIFTGIVHLAKTDAQLASVIGHEMAHANLGHIEKGQFNAFLGAVGGAAIDAGFLLGGVSTGGAFGKAFQKAGARAFSVDFEREADYVGAYYVARAGYDLAGVEQFWYAAGQADPDSIRFATTHPTAPARFVQMQKVAAEIAEKRRRGVPLEPELKTVHAEGAGTDAVTP